MALLSVPVAAWMVYLIKSSARFGKSWTASDPYAERIAGIADRVGNDTAALAAEILAIDTIFDRRLADSVVFQAQIVDGLDGLLSDDPIGYVRRICERPANAGLKASAANGIVRKRGVSR